LSKKFEWKRREQKMSLIPMVLVNDGGQERNYDLYSRLLRDRIIMLTGVIEEDMASLVVSEILYLQSEDDSKPIHIYIQSPGGSVTAGNSILGAMAISTCPIYTYCVGQCASMASVILSCGDKGRRYCLPYSRVMIHQVSSGADGKVSDMKRSIQEADRLNDFLAGILAKQSGKDVDTLKKDMELDFYMSAEEAKAYGLVDEIIKEVVRVEKK